MKKYILIIMILCLIGCTPTSNKKPSEVTKDSIQELTFIEWKYLFNDGYGNEDGYYHMRDTDEEGGIVCNIYYLDYKTQKEIYLCDKPECKHNTPNCPSYLEGISMHYTIFVYEKSLYLIKSAISGTVIEEGGSESIKNTPNQIIKMDLDGRNKELVYEDDGELRIDCTDFVVSGDSLYVIFSDDERVTINGSTEVISSKKLYEIDTKKKESKELCSVTNKSIAGVDNRNIIFNEVIYENDLNEYIKNNDYEGYEKAIINSTNGYSSFNVDTLKESDTIETKMKTAGVYHRGKIYYDEKHSLYELDLETGKEKEVKSFDKKKNQFISFIYDDKLFIEESVEDGDDYVFERKYIYNPDTGDFVENTLTNGQLKGAIDIYGETKDSFLVKYKVVGKYEKSWAGTMQFEDTKHYYGLIKKEDYYNNKENYQNIELLGDL